MWNTWAEGATVVVSHGQLGGKLTEKRYEATPKNEGRSNETSVEAQALVESEAKYVLQLKRGYYKTQAEAKKHVEFTPMKCQNSDDQKHKLKFPCYIQRKYNGQKNDD